MIWKYIIRKQISENRSGETWTWTPDPLLHTKSLTTLPPLFLFSLKEWLSFSLGSLGMNQSMGKTNCIWTALRFSGDLFVFRAPIHSPWIKKKRHSFLIFTMLPTRTHSSFQFISGHLTSFDVLITAYLIPPTAELLVDSGYWGLNWKYLAGFNEGNMIPL